MVAMLDTTLPLQDRNGGEIQYILPEKLQFNLFFAWDFILPAANQQVRSESTLTVKICLHKQGI